MRWRGANVFSSTCAASTASSSSSSSENSGTCFSISGVHAILHLVQTKRFAKGRTNSGRARTTRRGQEILHVIYHNSRCTELSLVRDFCGTPFLAVLLGLRRPPSVYLDPVGRRAYRSRQELRGCKAQREKRWERERLQTKNLLTFAFCSPKMRGGRGNGKRVASAPLPAGSPEPDATR